jgi:hypothetical protein
MNALYILGGIALLAFGIWQTITTTKVFLKGTQDKLRADIKISGSGIMSIMIGAYLIIHYI